MRKLRHIVNQLAGKLPGKQDTMHIDIKKILKYLPPSPSIIDCGAHIGTDSIKLSKIPGSTVYAFEPVKTIFAQLVDNTKQYKNIFCFNLALNNADGKVEMHISSGASDGSSSILPPKTHIVDHPEVFFTNKETVSCQTLDSWARKKGISKVDMLWLDMQGAEQKMLQASRNILEKVFVIHTEVSVRETYEGVEDYSAYKNFLEESGFKVVIEAIPAGYDMGNVLFVRR